MFFTSTRNSIAAHKFLLKSLDCTTFLTSSPTPPIINAIAAAYPLKLLQVPSVQELLERKYPHYPYKKTFEDSKCDPLLVLHTSGSTGMPKPIIWTHEWAAAYQMWSQMDTPDGFEARDKLYGGDRLFPFLPAFHVS
jgi:acyl-coenzyme A synthetase/AMP-(fatty) acid ligase